MEATTTGPIHFLNVSYFFRLIYEALTQAQDLSFQMDLVALIGQIWIIVSIISFAITVWLLVIFVHSTIRFHQIHESELPDIATLDPVVAEVTRDHHRWDHVRALIESGQPSDWRQAIIEADIMLYDLLDQLGYQGLSVGDRLKQADPERFHTLQNAWEAHKVRNEIAHQGMNYELTEHIAHRTIANYEAVMREHGEI